MIYFYVDDCEAFAKKADARLSECRPFYTAARKQIGKRTALYTCIAMKVCDDLGGPSCCI